MLEQAKSANMEQLRQILERLNHGQVEYVLVGGLAGVFTEFPLVTRDVDICMPFTEPNLLRLEKALAGLNPFHRQTPNRLPSVWRKISPAALKNMYLRTDLGVLDCLGEIKGVGDFTEVSRQSVVAELPIGLSRILSLSALIQAKKGIGPHSRQARL